MKRQTNIFLCILVGMASFLLGGTASAQDLSIRNNLLYDASGTPNLGVEYPLGKHISIGANFGFKSWPRFLFWDTEYKENTRHWKHLLAVPEFRYYLDQVYDGWFAGADLIYTHYNVGNVKFPLGLYPEVQDHRVQGDFIGGGLFMGYSWWIGSHWRIEAEAGVGFGLAAQDKFECDHCGTRLGEERKPVLIPKLGLNIAWNLLPRHEIIEGISRIDTIQILRPLLMVAQVAEIGPEHTSARDIADKAHWVSPIEQYRSIDEVIHAPMDSVRYVLFPLDSINLRRSFADNAAVLDQIVEASRRIMADNRDSLALIQIVGLASVEGEWKHNKWLGEGRAQAMKEYVMRELGLKDNQIEAEGRGEAWPWFRTQIARLLPEGGSGLTPGQAQWLLDLIDNEPNPDVREQKMKADKALYKALKENILADQRNSGYVHIYFHTKPDKVAESLNKVNDLIRDHKYAEALQAYESNSEYLDRTKVDAEAANAYGIAMFGAAVELEKIDTLRAEKAREILMQAEEMGSSCARGNLDGTEEFLRKYKEYEEQKRYQEALKQEILNDIQKQSKKKRK